MKILWNFPGGAGIGYTFRRCAMERCARAGVHAAGTNEFEGACGPLRATPRLRAGGGALWSRREGFAFLRKAGRACGAILSKGPAGPFELPLGCGREAALLDRAGRGCFPAERARLPRDFIGWASRPL